MKILIRADASADIGSGHVSRCLALAETLRERGATVTFACRVLPGDMRTAIASRDFGVSDVCEPGSSWNEAADLAALEGLFPGRPAFDWAIVDHYQLGLAWERRMKTVARRVMAIDDFPDREHSADIVLDQNLSVDDVPRAAGAGILLQGPRYALLRQEFRDARHSLRSYDGEIRSVLVFYGGADPDDETSKVVRALGAMSGRRFAVEVVVGGSNPRREAVRILCASYDRVAYHCDVSDMAARMAAADVAFGAAGSASWERCSVGLPAVMTVLADNQERIAAALQSAGAALNLGWYHCLTEEDYRRAAESLRSDAIVGMRKVCLSLVDAEGPARVADRIFELGTKDV